MKKKTETTKMETKFKKFDLNSNNFRGLLTSIRLFVAILTVIILVIIIKSIFFNKNVVNYSLVYNKKDSGFVLLNKKNKKVELSKPEDSVSDVLYANNTEKYVLYKKNNSLYLYTANKKDEVVRILKKVKKFYFSPQLFYTTDE